MDAMVEITERDGVVGGGTRCFQLAALDRISPLMVAWLRERLAV
jgi:hypothetical protein